MKKRLIATGLLIAACAPQSYGQANLMNAARRALMSKDVVMRDGQFFSSLTGRGVTYKKENEALAAAISGIAPAGQSLYGMLLELGSEGLAHVYRGAVEAGTNWRVAANIPRNKVGEMLTGLSAAEVQSMAGMVSDDPNNPYGTSGYKNWRDGWKDYMGSFLPQSTGDYMEANQPWEKFNAAIMDLSGQNFEGLAGRVTGSQLNGAKSITGADLSGLDLNGFSVSNRNMTGVDLSGTSGISGSALNSASALGGMNLSGLNLSGFNPTKAITGTDLSNATGITGANLNGTPMNGLEGVRFAGINLSGLNMGPAGGYPLNGNKSLFGADLRGSTNYVSALNLTSNAGGVNLAGMDLRGVNGDWKHWSGANFEGANLNSSSWKTTWAIDNANFRNAQLPPTWDYERNYTGVDFRGSTGWTNGHLNQGINFTNTDLTTVPSSAFAGFRPGQLIYQRGPGAAISTPIPPLAITFRGAKMPSFADTPAKFVAATGYTPVAGTIWIDGSRPWG